MELSPEYALEPKNIHNTPFNNQKQNKISKKTVATGTNPTLTPIFSYFARQVAKGPAEQHEEPTMPLIKSEV